MRDRIPTYPGRVKLVPVPGQTDTFDLVRADEPTEVGTPLNKGNLLSDDTAAHLWAPAKMPNNPTVNLALFQSAKNIIDLDIRKKEYTTFELFERGLI